MSSTLTVFKTGSGLLEGLWLGLELRLLFLQHATATSYRPRSLTFICRSAIMQPLTSFCQVVETLPSPNHPTVLASQVVWISGESQFFQLLSKLIYIGQWKQETMYTTEPAIAGQKKVHAIAGN